MASDRPWPTLDGQSEMEPRAAVVRPLLPLAYCANMIRYVANSGYLQTDAI